MKPDYLERKVTIDRHGFTVLCSELTREVIENASSAEAAVYALSIGLLQGKLSEMLELGTEPKTFSAEDFAAAVFLHQTLSYHAGVVLANGTQEDFDGPNMMHLGIDAVMACRIADKLFGKDEDFEEQPAEKDGDEAC